MSNISSIIEVYRMKEIAPLTRANIMIALGQAINDEYSMNITDELIGELLLTMPVNVFDLKRPGWHPNYKKEYAEKERKGEI